jgi:soluble lytic murein transglycosylase-like protein
MSILNDWRVSSYLDHIKKASRKYGVPEEVIASIIIQESAGNPRAFASGENSRGLMQISENVAVNEYGITNSPMILDSILFDPAQNIDYGARHLRDKYNIIAPHFDKNISERDKWMIVASTYNQGQKWWMQALDYVTIKGGYQDWNSVRDQIMSFPIPTATRNHVDMYGPNVIGRTSSLSTEAGSGGIGFDWAKWTMVASLMLILGGVTYVTLDYANKQSRLT